MRPWSSVLLALSIYPAVEKSPWNISRSPSTPRNAWTLGKQAVLGDNLAASPGGLYNVLGHPGMAQLLGNRLAKALGWAGMPGHR